MEIQLVLWPCLLRTCQSKSTWGFWRTEKAIETKIYCYRTSNIILQYKFLSLTRNRQKDTLDLRNPTTGKKATVWPKVQQDFGTLKKIQVIFHLLLASESPYTTFLHLLTISNSPANLPSHMWDQVDSKWNLSHNSKFFKGGPQLWCHLP